MRIWLIGCGALLVIGIVAAVFFGNILVKQFKASANKIDEAASSFHQLEREYPFVKKPHLVLTSDQIGRFVDSRRQVIDVLNSHIEQWKNEEASVFDKLTLSMDIAPALAKTHVDALQRNRMSASEYFWIMNQVLLVLRYGESDEAPSTIQGLRQAFENPVGTGADNLTESENLDTFLTESQAQIVINLLPQVEPWQILISEEMVKPLIENAEGLEETMAAFYYYDLHFKNTFSTVTEQAEQNLDPTPGSGSLPEGDDSAGEGPEGFDR